MRRRIGRMLTLALALLLGGMARADMRLPYAADTVISVRGLTRDQQKLAEFLYQPLLEGSEKIDLPENTRYDDVSAAMTSLMQDYPELFHLDKQYQVGYLVNRPERAIYVTPRYRMGRQEADTLRTALYQQARTVLGMGTGAEWLHDVLLLNVSYGGSTDLRHTAVGALLYGQATCEGYAQALTLLYRMAGIPCGMVVGDARENTGATARHAWNIANVGGMMLIDATWNDQDKAGVNTQWYYGLSTEQMGRDHTPDREQQLPRCGDQANWHRVRGYLADDRQDVYGLIRLLALYDAPVNVRVTDRALFQALAADTAYDFIGDYNDQCARGEEFYGSYSVLVNDTQQCVMIFR